ncbi:MAG: hypothetical protein OEQ39_02155 [Gammaproteobacteria bacterium]|nr:hypothetical protein [Gammaproteobacteria bacterium]
MRPQNVCFSNANNLTNVLHRPVETAAEKSRSPHRSVSSAMGKKRAFFHNA